LALHQLNEPLRAETAAAIALSLDPRGLRRDAVMIASFPALLLHACPYISCAAQLGAAPESFEGATELDKALKAALPGTTIVLAPGLHDVTLGEVRVPLRLVGLGAGIAEQRAVVRQRSRLMVYHSALYAQVLIVSSDGVFLLLFDTRALPVHWKFCPIRFIWKISNFAVRKRGIN
jgi:hypothetical protein